MGSRKKKKIDIRLLIINKKWDRAGFVGWVMIHSKMKMRIVIFLFCVYIPSLCQIVSAGFDVTNGYGSERWK